ncbi:MAG: SIMPL domain-containing protein [Comamonas sp.]
MKWSRRATAAFAVMVLPLSVMAQANGAGNNALYQGPTLTLEAEATQRVAQDTAWALFSVEKESKDQAQAQQAGKAALAEVTAIIKKSSSLQVSTENLFTSPVYNKDGKITNWRTNFNVQFESTDTTQVAQTMAALMDKARLSGSGFRLSEAAAKKAQEQLIGDAVKAFDAKAKLSASAMGFSRYEYGSINLNQSGNNPPIMRASRGAMMASKMDSGANDPVALEPGYTTVSVSMSGSVKLIK